MKKALQAKLKNKSGFTLIELLIVVAIIAILIAISIPLIANAMDKAKLSTDASNERGAKAEMVIASTDTGKLDNGKTVIAPKTIYAYDAAAGKLLNASTESAAVSALNPYGQSGSDTDTTNVNATAGDILYVFMDDSGTVYYAWQPPNIGETALKSDTISWTKGAGPRMQAADGKNSPDTDTYNNYTGTNPDMTPGGGGGA